MRKKLNRTSVIILIVAALTVAVPSLIVYSYYDRARKGEQLIAAIDKDDTAKAISLLKSGADPNHVGTVYEGRRAAIEVACAHRNPAIVRYLLSQGVKSWVIGQDKGYLIRTTASNYNNNSTKECIEIIKMLIDYGADINATNPDDPAPIFRAIASDQNDVVQFLVDHGANVNVIEAGNSSPLVSAAVGGNTSAVRILLTAGADPSKCGTTFGQLIKSAQRFDHKETVAILKDAMAKRKAAATTVPKK